MRSPLFPVLAIYTVYHHGRSIVSLNKLLIIGWAAEDLLRFVSAFLDYFWPENPVHLFMIDWILSEVNYITFIYIIFRLKAVEIYLDKSNDSKRIIS